MPTWHQIQSQLRHPNNPVVFIDVSVGTTVSTVLRLNLFGFTWICKMSFATGNWTNDPRAFRRCGANDKWKFPAILYGRIPQRWCTIGLQRSQFPSSHQRFYDSGWRFRERKNIWMRFNAKCIINFHLVSGRWNWCQQHLRWNICWREFHAEAWFTGTSIDGQQRQRHKRMPILYNLRQMQFPWQQTCGVWTSFGRFIDYAENWKCSNGTK